MHCVEDLAQAKEAWIGGGKQVVLVEATRRTLGLRETGYNLQEWEQRSWGGGVGSKKEGQTEDWGLVQKASDLCHSRG